MEEALILSKMHGLGSIISFGFNNTFLLSKGIESLIITRILKRKNRNEHSNYYFAIIGEVALSLTLINNSYRLDIKSKEELIMKRCKLECKKWIINWLLSLLEKYK